MSMTPWPHHQKEKEILTDAGEKLAMSNKDENAFRVWQIAPGPNAWQWPECRSKGFIALSGMREHSLTEFESEEAMGSALEAGGHNAGLAASLWKFGQVLKPGDIVIAGKGNNALVGIGVIIGPYLPPNDPASPTSDPYQVHVRRVDWRINASVPLGANFFGTDAPTGVTDVTPEQWTAVKAFCRVRRPELAQRIAEMETFALALRKGEVTVPELPKVSEPRPARPARTSAKKVGTAPVEAAPVEAPPAPLSVPDPEPKPAAEPKPAPASLPIEPDVAKAPVMVIIPPLAPPYVLPDLLEPLPPAPATDVAVTPPPPRATVAWIREIGDPNVPEPLRPLMDAASRTANLLVSGPPGTGKTWLVQQFAVFYLLWNNVSPDEALRYWQAVEGRKWARAQQISAQVRAETDAAASAGSSRNFLDYIACHPGLTYETFVEAPAPQLRLSSGSGEDMESGEGNSAARRALPGMFLNLCQRAAAAWRQAHPNRPPQFVLILDDLHRVDIARVFGELVPLIENDRRMGQRGALTATLPYSHSHFGVPPNLLILGTLPGTEALQKDDTLRRRFAVLEMNSQPEALGEKSVGGVKLALLLARLNARLAVLKGDASFSVGHHYLTDVTQDDVTSLYFAWYRRIVPLLTEWFRNEPALLRSVLGIRFVREDHRSSEGLFETPLPTSQGDRSHDTQWILERFTTSEGALRGAFDEGAFLEALAALAGIPLWADADL